MAFADIEPYRFREKVDLDVCFILLLQRPVIFPVA